MESDRDELTELRDRLDTLRGHIVSGTERDNRLGEVDPRNLLSARNLAHYRALRQHDLRGLQGELARWGLSSLGRAEAQVLPTVDAVRRATGSLARAVPDDPEPGVDPEFDQGRRLLDEHANALLGPARPGRQTRIMVTLPSEAATDAELVERIIAAGAELVRVNCAHDGPEAWSAMIRNVRAAATDQGLHVKIVMDLAGPKLRTGPIAAGPQVFRARPGRDALGRSVTAAEVWITADDSPRTPGDGAVGVEDPDWLGRRVLGERIALRDARGSRRTMVVVLVLPDRILTTCADTSYLTPGTKLAGHGGDLATVAELAAQEQKLILHSGDTLTLTRNLDPVEPDVTHPHIGCTLPQVFRDARAGHRIFFDDGRIGGVIEATADDELRVRVTEASPRGSKLGAAKGINLPDTELRLPALSEEDLAHLSFVAQHADAVGLSFVRSADDVDALQRRLADLGRLDLGLILKVETVAGFAQLPAILLTAMRSPHVGVMIARGDLAVEAGYARMGELQEEILWLCEAAHVPVVWATEVLDRLARTGRPSRAEVTDAAMSGRAECVMLNKGPFVDHAVTFLDDILSRMAEHQRKKGPLLRRLNAWDVPE